VGLVEYTDLLFCLVSYHGPGSARALKVKPSFCGRNGLYLKQLIHLRPSLGGLGQDSTNQ
jgi:hypothetical protein